MTFFSVFTLPPLTLRRVHSIINFAGLRALMRQVWHTLSRDHTVLPATHIAFTNKWNEPYLLLPSQPKLVLIYKTRGDRRA